MSKVRAVSPPGPRLKNPKRRKHNVLTRNEGKAYSKQINKQGTAVQVRKQLGKGRARYGTKTARSRGKHEARGRNHLGYPESYKSRHKIGFCSGVNGSSSERSEAGGQPLRSTSKLLLSQDFRISHFLSGLTCLHQLFRIHLCGQCALQCVHWCQHLSLSQSCQPHSPHHRKEERSPRTHTYHVLICLHFQCLIFLVICLFTTGSKK